MISSKNRKDQIIPISVPSIKGNEWKYIKECLDTEWVSTAGRFVDTFEEEFCDSMKVQHAVACINGTSALQVALRIVGVKAGDEVIVPTVTFIAPVNALRYINAEPVFMDCDEFYNIDIAKTIQFIEKETIFQDGTTTNRKTGKRISAIVPVHVFGNAADLEALMHVCKQRNIRIVEDATESLGSSYTRGELSGRFTGTVGDIGCYSFNGNKIMTTGGGGMLVTNNDGYAKKASYLVSQAKDDPVRYIHNEVGYNYRLTNIQAAMGVAQLEKLQEFIEAKEQNYKIYKDGIDKIHGLHLNETPDYAQSNYWFYCLQVDKEKYGKDRDELIEHLSKSGIQSRPLWYLNHMQVPYKSCQSYAIDKAYDLLEKTINIPCSANLTEKQIKKVIKVLGNG